VHENHYNDPKLIELLDKLNEMNIALPSHPNNECDDRDIPAESENRLNFENRDAELAFRNLNLNVLTEKGLERYARYLNNSN
jgi:hypothetical protein